jgi:hypothetical protein
VAYDLILTNASRVPATIDKVDVVDAAHPDRVVVSYSGTAVVDPSCAFGNCDRFALLPSSATADASIPPPESQVLLIDFPCGACSLSHLDVVDHALNSARQDGAPGPLRPRRPEDFDAIYQGKPGWDIGRPQPAFLALAEDGMVFGTVLDVGCGTGEHALMAAARGCDAVGVDMAAVAIATAERKASDRGLPARFLVANALDLESLDQRFDTVSTVVCSTFSMTPTERPTHGALPR